MTDTVLTMTSLMAMTFLLISLWSLLQDLQVHLIKNSKLYFYCEKCKKRTKHSEHGFEGINYRIDCDECETIKYTRDGF